MSTDSYELFENLREYGLVFNKALSNRSILQIHSLKKLTKIQQDCEKADDLLEQMIEINLACFSISI